MIKFCTNYNWLKKWKVPSFSERAEIIGKKIVEFVTEMIRDFHFEEDEELFFVEECITQKD